MALIGAEYGWDDAGCRQCRHQYERRFEEFVWWYERRVGCCGERGVVGALRPQFVDV